MPLNPTPLRYARLVLIVILLSFFFDPFFCSFSFFYLYSLNLRHSLCCFSLSFLFFSFSSCFLSSSLFLFFPSFLLLYVAVLQLTFCVIRVRTMLLSGAPLESAHWPLTVDVVSMVKEACSRRPVPVPPSSPYSCCYVTALLFFFFFFFPHLSVVTRGHVMPPAHYPLTYYPTVCVFNDSKSL